MERGKYEFWPNNLPPGRPSPLFPTLDDLGAKLDRIIELLEKIHNTQRGV